MKKYINLVLIILFALVIVGCKKKDKEVQASTNGIVMTSSLISDSLYLYKPNTEITGTTPYDLVYSYRDDDNYYYGFDLGTFKNVIVDDNPYSMRYMGPANIKRTYVTSKVSSTSIENQSSWLEQRLEYDDKIAGVSFGVEIGVKDIFSAKLSTNFQYYSNTTTTTNSIGETVKQEVTVTESQSIEITFDSTCPYGEYRISHVMDYDVFAIATKSIENGKITINLMTLPRKGIIELYEYSNNGFSDIKLTELDFDISIVNDLPVPVDYIKSKDEIPDVVQPLPDSGDTTKYAGGNGTVSEPYRISNREHFINMINAKAGYFELIADIDLGDWSEYGIKKWAKNSTNSPNDFSGTFNGNNHSVTFFIKVGKTSLKSWAFGLFPTVAHATIKNLYVNADIQTYDPQNRGEKWDIHNDDRAEDAMIGGIIGYAKNSTVTNCTVSGIIRYNSDGGGGDTAVGGIIGYATSTAITECICTATLYGRGFSLSVAGIIAIENGSVFGKCEFKGAITTKNDWLFGETYIGDYVARQNKKIL